ncbi:hypothetical protein GCM10008932_05450 [Alkalibacterium iburiense]|uniref:Lipoprotein n=1 Tax=Alkalibacterium iburiense TaxID=290589 RepID=A0ABN0X548_9LACT
MNFRLIYLFLLLPFIAGCTKDMSGEIERLEEDEIISRFESYDMPNELIQDLSSLQRERMAYYLEENFVFLEHMQVDTIQSESADSDLEMHVEAFLFKQESDRYAIIPRLTFNDSVRVNNDIYLYAEGNISEESLLYVTRMGSIGFSWISFQPENVTRRTLSDVELVTYIEFELIEDYPKDRLDFTIVYAHDNSFFNQATYETYFNRYDLLNFGEDEEDLDVFRQVIPFESILY